MLSSDLGPQQSQQRWGAPTASHWAGKHLQLQDRASAVCWSAACCRASLPTGSHMRCHHLSGSNHAGARQGLFGRSGHRCLSAPAPSSGAVRRRQRCPARVQAAAASSSVSQKYLDWAAAAGVGGVCCCAASYRKSCTAPRGILQAGCQLASPMPQAPPLSQGTGCCCSRSILTPCYPPPPLLQASALLAWSRHSLGSCGGPGLQLTSPPTSLSSQYPAPRRWWSRLSSAAPMTSLTASSGRGRPGESFITH